MNLTPVIRNGLAFLIADSLELEDVSEDQWQATLDFAVPEFQSAVNQPKQVGECTFSFDGTGGRVLIKEAYAQRKYGENAPTHNGGINVVDGVAEGVEIVIPALAFNVTQKFEGATITLPWLRQIIFAAGTVNSDRFLGFEPGEVLFLGPSGSQPFAFMADGTVSFGEREVEFRFAVSPNLTVSRLVTSKTSTKMARLSVDRVCAAKDSLSESKGITSKPIGVYVAQVYRRIPFSLLGINDPSNFPVA